MKPAGAELSRRWLAALLMVPIDERERVVEAVEKQIVESYEPTSDDPEGAADVVGETLYHVRDEPVQKEGYTEQEIRTYAPAPESDRSDRSGKEREA